MAEDEVMECHGFSEKKNLGVFCFIQASGGETMCQTGEINRFLMFDSFCRFISYNIPSGYLT